MKHADQKTLEQLADLLEELRRIPGLVEKKPGTFYRRSRSVLHFHDDPTGPYADVRLDPTGDFERVRVRTLAERRRLVRQVRAGSPR